MSGFARSIDGLSNYKDFHAVDIIVFSEGGDAAAVTEDAECNVWSIDSLFWKSVINKYMPEKTIKIKSLGSKNNVLVYADKIQNLGLKNSIAVLDRDHDAHRNVLINHPRVVYTLGYSWENDAWGLGGVVTALCDLHPAGDIGKATIESIEEEYENFFKAVNRLVFFDVLCSMQMTQGIPNDFGSLVEVHGGVRFKLRTDQFRAIVSRKRRERLTPFKYHKNFRTSPSVDCYGKLMAEFGYNVLTKHYKVITKSKSLNRQHADQMIAKNMRNDPSKIDGGGISGYYSRVLKAAHADL